MMTFEKVLEVFNDYLNKDSVLEVVNTKRGYTVMIWDEKDEQWFGVEKCQLVLKISWHFCFWGWKTTQRFSLSISS